MTALGNDITEPRLHRQYFRLLVVFPMDKRNLHVLPSPIIALFGFD